MNSVFRLQSGIMSLFCWYYPYVPSKYTAGLQPGSQGLYPTPLYPTLDFSDSLYPTFESDPVRLYPTATLND